MARTFISYRRDDSAGHAGQLYGQLRGRLGPQQVFMDIASIEPGQDFVEVIDSAVATFDCVLVVIGRRRLSTARMWDQILGLSTPGRWAAENGSKEESDG